MKMFVITDDGRTLVKEGKPEEMPLPRQIHKGRKKGTIIICPCCNAEVPYSVICKQFDFKKKFNRKIILDIIKSENPTVSGVVAQRYKEITGRYLIYRTLLNILKEFRKQGLVDLKVHSKGRYGRTTIITLLNSQQKEKISHEEG
jgi:hypothetical protein